MPNNMSQQNIYAYNILKSSKVHFDKDYSFLFSTILHLESELRYEAMDVSNFAEKLLTTINQSEAFPHLDRACLAITHPGSSRIKVLSSFNTDKLGTNEITGNYSCFVSTKSSIFKTKESNIRIYSNIEEIISRYEGKPIQRSLSRLKKMGVKSGITIPIYYSDFVSCFLFLNSASESHFSALNDQDYSLLCLIKLVSLSCINKALLSTNGPESKAGKILADAHQYTNIFSINSFTKLLGLALESRFNKNVVVNVTNEVAQDFLYAINPTIYTILKVVECLESCPNELIITLTEKDLAGSKFVELKISKLSVSIEQLAFLQKLKFFTNHEVGISRDDFYILTPLDIFDTVDYSI